MSRDDSENDAPVIRRRHAVVPWSTLARASSLLFVAVVLKFSQTLFFDADSESTQEDTYSTTSAPKIHKNARRLVAKVLRPWPHSRLTSLTQAHWHLLTCSSILLDLALLAAAPCTKLAPQLPPAKLLQLLHLVDGRKRS
jgi:hypothetical protein